jgi:hypothetical protein
MAPRDPSDPNDPRQRPSIFPRPEEADDLRPPDPPRRAPPPDWHDTATRAHATVPSSGDHIGEPVHDGPRTALSPGPGQRHHRRSRGQLAAIGTMIVVLLAGAGFVAASVLRTQSVEPAGVAASESPEPTATLSPGISPSPEPSATNTAAATTAPPAAAPTTVAAPAGPPHELAARGWASVSVGELNVRAEPGLGATSVYRLVRGAVVHLLDEAPATRDGLLWYRVVSLGGATGWAASGPDSSPFLETIAEAGDLIRCGPVTGKVYDAGGGSLTPADPVRIGDLALPASAFDAAELGTLELLRGNEQDACFAARASSGERPTVLADFGATTCGRPVAVGDYFELRVAIGQDVVTEFVAKRTTFVHPSLLLNGPQTDPMSVNLRSSIGVLAAADGATVCVHSYARDDPFHTYRMVDGAFCGTVEAINGSELVVRSSGEGRFRFLSSASWVASEALPVGERTRLMVNTSLWADDRYVNVWRAEPARGC